MTRQQALVPSTISMLSYPYIKLLWSNDSNQVYNMCKVVDVCASVGSIGMLKAFHQRRVRLG